MYSFALWIHSLLRWAVLVTALLAVLRAVPGWLGGKPWTPADDNMGRWFVLSLDAQFLVGLVLYVALSPFTTQAFGDFGAAMRDPGLRFWAVEHAVLMIAAIALAHIGRARLRRATTDPARHRTAAVFFTMALFLVLVAIPWPGLPNGRPLLRTP